MVYSHRIIDHCKRVRCSNDHRRSMDTSLVASPRVTPKRGCHALQRTTELWTICKIYQVTVRKTRIESVFARPPYVFHLHTQPFVTNHTIQLSNSVHQNTLAQCNIRTHFKHDIENRGWFRYDRNEHPSIIW